MHTPAEAGQRKVDRVAPQVAIDSPIGRPSVSRVLPRLLACAESLGTQYKRPAGAQRSGRGILCSVSYCQAGFCARAFCRHAPPIYSLRKTTPDTPCRRSIYSPLLGLLSLSPEVYPTYGFTFIRPDLSPLTASQCSRKRCLHRTTCRILPRLGLLKPSRQSPRPRCPRPLAVMTPCCASGSSAVSELTLLRVSL
jgi:hypothetical protein